MEITNEKLLQFQGSFKDLNLARERIWDLEECQKELTKIQEEVKVLYEKLVQFANFWEKFIENYKEHSNY